MRQIAVEAGVHVTTVSLALRAHPRIPQETRARIQEIATRMGYHHNPRIGWLMGQLRSTKTAHYRSNIAYLAPSADRVRYDPYYRRHFEGAQSRASQLGFQIELFAAEAAKASSLGRTLRARGIPGVLISGLEETEFLLSTEWNRFTAVTVGFALPHLPCVCNHQFDSAVCALRELTARGYRRIGLHLSVGDDLWSNHAMCAAYLHYQQSVERRDRLPYLLYENDEVAGFHRWLRRTRPDAVLTDNGNIITLLGEAGFKAPGDIGCAHLHWIPEHGPLAGMYQSLEAVGSAAVDLLSGMLQRGETGAQTRAQTLMIEGRWHEGKSIRRQPVPAS